jgi:hypothetical protein
VACRWFGQGESGSVDGRVDHRDVEKPRRDVVEEGKVSGPRIDLACPQRESWSVGRRDGDRARHVDCRVLVYAC